MTKLAQASLLLLIASSPALADDESLQRLKAGSTFAAADSLSCGHDSNDDANDCLRDLGWKPDRFTVRLEKPLAANGDFLVRFPSPRPIGDAVNDLVSMEWYAARNEKHDIQKSRAVVVVHESAHSMPVGRLIARSLSGQGYHAFLVHLPGYGPRHADKQPTNVRQILPQLQQGIADARRARDAVVALPAVDSTIIGLEGTSLGGFVAATVAGLDHGYNRVFILLAGGNIDDVILHGARDAAKVHAKLQAAGLTDDQIKELAHHIEPLRLACRIDPANTWLFSGAFDTVVPPRCSLALATKAKLPKDHHVEFLADHYLGFVYFPELVQEITQHMHDSVQTPHSSTIAH